MGKDETCGERRKALALAGASAALLLLGAGRAEARSSQASVAYRSSPRGGQSCANCVWFAPPSACGAVSGKVSARGWCNIWSG